MESRADPLKKLRYDTVKTISIMADETNATLLKLAEDILSNKIPAQDIEEAYTQLADLTRTTSEVAELASVLTTLSLKIADLTQFPEPVLDEKPPIAEEKTALEKPTLTKPYSCITEHPNKLDVILSLLRALRKQVVTSIVDKTPSNFENYDLFCLYGTIINDNETDLLTFPTFIQLTFEAASKSPQKTLNTFAVLLNMLHESIENIEPSHQEEHFIDAEMNKLSIDVAELLNGKLSFDEEKNLILTIGMSLQNLTRTTPQQTEQLKTESNSTALTSKPPENIAAPADTSYTRWYSFPLYLSFWSGSTATLSAVKSAPAAAPPMIKKPKPPKEAIKVYMGIPKKLLNSALEEDFQELLNPDPKEERQLPDYKTYPRC